MNGIKRKDILSLLFLWTEYPYTTPSLLYCTFFTENVPNRVSLTRYLQSNNSN